MEATEGLDEVTSLDSQSVGALAQLTHSDQVSGVFVSNLKFYVGLSLKLEQVHFIHN